MTQALSTPGIHHVTAIASDPSANHAFYTETLGLRLVKQSVNQDDVGVYHLFYADRTGSPGTSMTFFPYVGARRGRPGPGQVTTVSFTIPHDSIEYWIDRLDNQAVETDHIERFGDEVIRFTDPDGLPLELVARTDAPAGDPPASPVPDAHAIRGFFAVELHLVDVGPMVDLLETMGYTQAMTDTETMKNTEPTTGEETDVNGRSAAGDDVTRQRFETEGTVGFVVDVITDPAAEQGQPGAGTVHHVAYQVTDESQQAWRELLQGQGLRPTEIIDRKWFRSVYARTHGGVLFEFATKEPGYDVDEPVESLGESLVLPEWLEDRRAEIEAGLPPLDVAPSEED